MMEGSPVESPAKRQRLDDAAAAEEAAEKETPLVVKEEEESCSKRRRVKPDKWCSHDASNREEELFQQALVNSREDKAMVSLPIEEAPTFYPTEEEFEDPMGYIDSIRGEAEPHGICLVVPPASFKPECAVDLETSDMSFATKLQRIDRLQESVPYADGKRYTPKQYKEMADSFQAAWELENDKDLCEAYWGLVDGSAEQRVSVEYGNDVDGTAFSKSSCDDKWALSEIPGQSLLKHFEVKMPGINSPWLYFGMLFSTFSWHNEDNYLASINYHHLGAPKQWYGVPGSHAGAFENVVRRSYKQRLLEVPDLLHHMNTMFSPSKLKNAHVPVYKALQRPGTFVVTFPQAFHSGFSYGFNLGEAVNFAPPSWIKHAKIASERYRRVGRLAVLSHDRLIFTLCRGSLSDFSDDYDDCKLLVEEAERLCREEFNLRPRLYAAGVRDVSSIVKPPRNDLTKGTIDAAAAEYDDKRVCVVCRHTCFSSAVACNCSQTNVSCLRHSSYLCKCPPTSKYLIEWERKPSLDDLLARLKTQLKHNFPHQHNTLDATNT